MQPNHFHTLVTIESLANISGRSLDKLADYGHTLVPIIMELTDWEIVFETKFKHKKRKE